MVGRCRSKSARRSLGCARLGPGVREIARRVGRDPSTVSRELRRVPRGPTNWKRPEYKASLAQADADQKARRPKPARLATNLLLRKEVQDRLKRKDSPEQIAHRLRVDFPDD